MNPRCPGGIYLLVDPQVLPESAWSELLPELLQTGLACVQLRSKDPAQDRRRQQAESLRLWTQQADCPLLINDDWQLAQHVGAEGVHLGQGDGELQRARAALGPQALIGRTCHASLELVQQSASEGADYASIGAVYSSRTKPQALPASVDCVQQASRLGVLPICAIGGIEAQHLPELRRAGAQLIAVCGSVLRAAQPLRAAQNLVRSWADG